MALPEVKSQIIVDLAVLRQEGELFGPSPDELSEIEADFGEFERWDSLPRPDYNHSPLLTPLEQFDLGRRKIAELNNPEVRDLQDWVKAIRNREKTIRKKPILTPDDKEELATFASNRRLINDRLNKLCPARRELIEKNTGLVFWTAEKYRKPENPPFSELVSAGMEGLIVAVDKYDPDHYPGQTLRFSTVAAWWIRQVVSDSVYDNRSIYLPLDNWDTLRKIIRTSDHLAQDLGHPPTYDEIAEAVGIRAESVELLLRASKKILSIFAPVTAETGASTLEDFIPSSDKSPEEEAEYNELVRRVVEVLKEHAGLTPRELFVVAARLAGYQFGDKQIQDRFKLYDIKSKQRAYQIWEGAFKKMCEPKVTTLLKGYTD